MTAKTDAQRQAARRARKAAAGEQEVRGIFAPLDEHEKIKAYAGKLAKKRKEQK